MVATAVPRRSTTTLSSGGTRFWLGGGLAVVAVAVVLMLIDTDLSVGELVRGLAAVALPLAAAGLLVTNGGRTLQGVGAILAGTIGISTCPALVAPLLSGAPAGMALVGLVGSAVSIGLLGFGGVRLYRGLGRAGRLAAVGVALVLAQFVVLPVLMATFGTHPIRTAASMSPPAGATRVDLAAADGVHLAGWYTPSRNGAAVVLLHGAGGSKADTTAHAAVLAAHGYGVLALDARGGGESGGHGMLWGWHGNLDVAAAIDYLGQRPDVEPTRIGAVGLSMGGEQAITAAAADARIRAVVAEGASARVPADVMAILPGGLSGAIQAVFYPIMWGAADLMSAASPPISLDDAVRSLDDRRLLLISSDDPSDKAAGPVLWRAATASVELWEPAGTGHTQALAVHPDEWRARVLGFLDRELGAR